MHIPKGLSSRVPFGCAHSRTGPSLRDASMTALRDKTDLRFLHFADAAFSRGRSAYVFATLRVSPMLSFTGVVLPGTETALSP